MAKEISIASIYVPAKRRASSIPEGTGDRKSILQSPANPDPGPPGRRALVQWKACTAEAVQLEDTIFGYLARATALDQFGHSARSPGISKPYDSVCFEFGIPMTDLHNN